jgi:O-antigen ligase/tetratricopeptide (TPR) repeat protein
VGVYLLLVALMRRPAIRAHLGRLALVLCVVVAALYIAEVLNAWMIWWDLVGRIAIPPLRPAYLGLLISPNPLATVVLALGALGVASTGLGGRVGRVAIGGIVLLVLTATFITGSRGAWLGTAFGIAAVAVAGVLARRENRVRALALLRTRSAAMALIVVVPLFIGAGALAALSGRLSLDDFGFRAGFTRASLQMFQESPLTGVGPGTWGVLRASHTTAPDPDLYIPHAHSIYLQVLAEFGLIGVIGAGVLLLMLGRLTWDALRSPDAARRRVGLAVLFVVMLLVGQQFADMLMNVPSVLLAAVLPIAWLDATALPAPDEESAQRTRASRVSAVLPVGAAALTVAILVGLIWVETAAELAGEGVDAANRNAWQEATTLTQQAVDGDPNLNIYRFQLGISAANTGDLARAEELLRESAATDDYRYAWLDLAAVRWQLGDDAGAREALVRAERLGLQRTALALAAGWLRQQLGDVDAARQNYVTAIAQAPTLVGDPFWDSPLGPDGGLDAILPTVEGSVSPIVLLQIHLILGDLVLAQRDVDALTPADPILYPLLMPAWYGDPDAWADLRAHAASRPLDPTPAQWCRLVAAYQGDEDSVVEYSIWLTIANFPDAGLPPIGRILFDASEPISASILDGYGTLYRRQVPAAQVVDPLPQFVLQNIP